VNIGQKTRKRSYQLSSHASASLTDHPRVPLKASLANFQNQFRDKTKNESACWVNHQFLKS